MKKFLVIILLTAFFSNVHANDWTGNLNFLLGQKKLDKDDWEPFEKQAEFGILVDFKQKEWPLSIAIDLLGSSDEEPILGFDVEARTSELDIGVRKVWEVSGATIKPFVGGGLAFISAELESRYGYASVSDDDSGTGYWLNAGVYWTLGPAFNLGLEWRYSRAEVTLYGIEAEAGGSHGGLILGYHW